MGDIVSFQFPSIGVYWWDVVQHLALHCSPSCKVEVIFTVRGYPHPKKKKNSSFVCIGTYSAHRTRVRSFLEGLRRISADTSAAFLPCEFGDVRFSCLVLWTLFHLPIVSNQNIYITGTSVSVISLFNLTFWQNAPQRRWYWWLAALVWLLSIRFCVNHIYLGYHSYSYQYVNLLAELQLRSRLNAWHEVYVARASVEFS